MPATSQDEHLLTLLSEARSGSLEALGHLLENHREFLEHIADRGLDSDVRAAGSVSDMVQQSFLEAHKDFLQFRGQTIAEMRAWLRTILDHNIANHIRMARAGRRHKKREIPIEVLLHDNPLIPAANTPSPSEHAITNEQSLILERLTECLSPDQQTVLRLRQKENRSFGEIAEIMGRTVAAVYRIWARAVEHIQNAAVSSAT